MSIKCVAERYPAYRIMLRISSMANGDMLSVGRELASKAEHVFGTDGSNLTTGEGYWKGDIEVGAIVEIVIRRIPDESDDWQMAGISDRLEDISRFVNVNLGMTCFATVEPTTAYELYELAE